MHTRLIAIIALGKGLLLTMATACLAEVRTVDIPISRQASVAQFYSERYGVCIEDFPFVLDRSGTDPGAYGSLPGWARALTAPGSSLAGAHFTGFEVFNARGESCHRRHYWRAQALISFRVADMIPARAAVSRAYLSINERALPEFSGRTVGLTPHECMIFRLGRAVQGFPEGRFLGSPALYPGSNGLLPAGLLATTPAWRADNLFTMNADIPEGRPPLTFNVSRTVYEWTRERQQRMLDGSTGMPDLAFAITPEPASKPNGESLDSSPVRRILEEHKEGIKGCSFIVQDARLAVTYIAP